MRSVIMCITKCSALRTDQKFEEILETILEKSKVQ